MTSPNISLRDLQKEYLNLINNVLPELALERDFPIRYNHCFGRVCLDNLFNDCWYNHLQQGKGSAYKQLTIEQLHVVINIAKSITKDKSYLIELNNKSLAWRKQTNLI